MTTDPLRFIAAATDAEAAASPPFFVDGAAVALALARYVAAMALAGHDPLPNSLAARRSARAHSRALMALCGLHDAPAAINALAVHGAPIHGPLSARQAVDLLDQVGHLAQLPSAAAAARGGRYQPLADDRLLAPIVPPDLR